MMWALALLGSIPAAFFFTGEDVDPDAEDEQNDQPVEAQVEDLEGDAEDEAQTYEASTGDAPYLIEDFEPNQDTFTLSTHDDDLGVFSAETVVDDNGAELGVKLHYASSAATAEITFMGLSEIPTTDIFVTVQDADADDAAMYGLDEVSEVEGMAPADSLAPNAADEAEVQSIGLEADIAIAADAADVAEVGTDREEGDEPAVLSNAPEEVPIVTDYELSAGGDTLVLSDDPFEDGSAAEIVLGQEGLTIETDAPLMQVTGSGSDDVIAAGDDAAIVNAGDGDDRLYAGEGTSILNGGSGNDVISGGDELSSQYVLNGEAGDDEIYGGDADELIIGGAGADILSGGAGHDTFVLDAEDLAEGGLGSDVFMFVEEMSSGDEGASHIVDFEVGEDILHVTIPAEFDNDDALALQMTKTEDGASSQLVMNGDVLAVLDGVANATLDDVVVEIAA